MQPLESLKMRCTCRATFILLSKFSIAFSILTLILSSGCTFDSDGRQAKDLIPRLFEQCVMAYHEFCYETRSASEFSEMGQQFTEKHPNAARLKIELRWVLSQIGFSSSQEAISFLETNGFSCFGSLCRYDFIFEYYLTGMFFPTITPSIERYSTRVLVHDRASNPYLETEVLYHIGPTGG